jgi:hypothetical protein
MKVVTARFPCVGLDETDFHLAHTTFEDNFTSTTYPYDNLKDTGIYGETGGNNYARINVDKAVNSDSYCYAVFDLSSIPDDATITSVSGKIRLYSSGTKAKFRQIRWCIGNIDDGPLRTSEAYSTSSNPVEIEVTPLRTSPPLTPQEMKQLKCYIHYQRNNQTDNTQRYIYMYGACLDVTYEVPELYVKENGLWTPVQQLYVKQNGE